MFYSTYLVDCSGGGGVSVLPCRLSVKCSFPLTYLIACSGGDGAHVSCSGGDGAHVLPHLLVDCIGSGDVHVLLQLFGRQQMS